MNAKWLFLPLLVVIGCQVSSDNTSIRPSAPDTKPLSTTGVTEPTKDKEKNVVPPSPTGEGNCAEVRKQNPCEWANAGDNVLYWRIKSVNVVTDDVVVSTPGDGQEYGWEGVPFDQCNFPSPAIEIKAEVLWSWLPIPSNDVSIIVGPHTLSFFGSPVYWDTTQKELIWNDPSVAYLPDMMIGAQVFQHPTSENENAFVMSAFGAFDNQNGQVNFYNSHESCIELPTEFQGLAFNDFTTETSMCAYNPNSMIRADQNKLLEYPPSYSTQCIPSP